MILPYLNMYCRVELGAVLMPQVVSFTISENIKSLGNSATIVLPRNISKLKGKPVTDYIKTGDKVVVHAGYNDNMAVEFTGYIRHIGAEIPLVIQCDDEFYPLKQNNLVKSYAATTLKQILQDIMPGYVIECPDMSFSKYVIDNASTYRVLQQLQKDYGLYSRVTDKAIRVGLAWDWNNGKLTRHKYHFQKNVKSSSLEWKSTDDFHNRVEVKLDKVKGQTQKVVKYGSNETDASVLSVHINGMSEQEAKEIAQAIYTNNSFDGFRGKFRGFGLPRTHAGDAAELTNGYEPEKDGAYLIEHVEIGFNEQEGYYRDNYLSYKI